MRKIEKQMIDAVMSRTSWSNSNTRVECNTPTTAEIFLHNNHIATFNNATDVLRVNLYTLRKWPSMTTRSRLRALGADLVSIKGTLHLNGQSIWEGA